MIEEPIRFGEDERLCGIVARPRNTSGNLPVVIFLSAGLLPKSGPYRMYTDIARALTAKGFTTFRLDLSGNGDSRGSISAESAERTIQADTQAAMDELGARFGVKQFVLFGLCSGAEGAHKTALADQRVTGIVALDGFIARNAAFYLWHYLPRLLSVEKWRQFLRNQISRLFSTDKVLPSDDSVEFWDGNYPSRDQLANEHRTLCERQVRQLLVFSGGSTQCSYTRQFHDVFRDVPCEEWIDTWYLPYADHTYLLRKDRTLLKRIVCRWFSERFQLAGQASAQSDHELPFYTVQARKTG